MKVKMEFDTNNETENAEYKVAVKAQELFLCLHDFSETILRRGRKHETFRGKELTDEEFELMEKIEEDFYEILSKYGIDLTEIGS